jgi:hypothetical protein
MPNIAAVRPAPDEYAPFYAKYVERVPEGNLPRLLQAQTDETLNLLASITEQQSLNRYAPDKWSIRELLGHIIDAERVFSYRALRIARGDRTPLPGFDQEPYVENGAFDRRAWSDLIDEYRAVRLSTLLLLRSFDDAAWERRGTASENEVSVRAIGYIIAGHDRHHIAILRERYLNAEQTA